MEIKITKSSPVCQLSGRPFVHDEEYVSVLRVREGELLREDYARDHWQDDFRKGSYSVWSTRFYDPKVAEQESPEVFSPLRQLFYEAVESEERVVQAEAFLAAQLLRRQKAFRLVKESDESETEVRVSLYADRIGNRLIQVRDPSFSYVEMEQARQRLLARLQELERPAGAAEVPVEESGQLSLQEGPAEDVAEALQPADQAPPPAPETPDDEDDEDEFDDDDEFDEDEDGEDEEEVVMDEEERAPEGDRLPPEPLPVNAVLTDVEPEEIATPVADAQSMDADSADVEAREETYEAKPIHS